MAKHLKELMRLLRIELKEGLLVKPFSMFSLKINRRMKAGTLK
jgi:hypothetical protein